MYVCGPTVYDSSHLGHARTYMTVDIMNRIMTSIANDKTHLVMNITDIDDKIIRKAHATGATWTDIAKTYEKSFFDSMGKLNVKLPDTIIRVSNVIPQIIAYIQVIIDNGFAYVTSDLSVYFDSNAYIKCGYEFDDTMDDDETAYHSTLSPLIRLQKRNIKDFALWKGRETTDAGFAATFIYDNNTIISWGRPGWHIECSAMIHKTIGSDIDIHFGGIDLKFPHHHNERLQAHAYYHPKFMPSKNPADFSSVTPWAPKFIHIGHLCIKGQKMSKSLKNFTTIDEALKRITPNQLRWMFILHKWSDQMDFSDDTITQTKVFDNTVINFLNRIINYPFDKKHVVSEEKEFVLLDYFFEIKNNIVTELCLFRLDVASGLFFELINRTNHYISTDYPNESLVRKIYDWVFYLMVSLGFDYSNKTNNNVTGVMNALISTRSEIRNLSRDQSVSKDTKQKLFHILDTERNIKLPVAGITLQDTKESSSWFMN